MASQVLADALHPEFVIDACGCDLCGNNISPGPCYTYTSSRGNEMYCVRCGLVMLDMLNRQVSTKEG